MRTAQSHASSGLGDDGLQKYEKAKRFEEGPGGTVEDAWARQVANRVCQESAFPRRAVRAATAPNQPRTGGNDGVTNSALCFQSEVGC